MCVYIYIYTHTQDILPNVVPIKLEHIVPYMPHTNHIQNYSGRGCAAKQGLEDGQEQGGCDMEDMLRESWMLC